MGLGLEEIGTVGFGRTALGKAARGSGETGLEGFLKEGFG